MINVSKHFEDHASLMFKTSEFQQEAVQYGQLYLNYAWKKPDHSEKGELNYSNLI